MLQLTPRAPALFLTALVLVAPFAIVPSASADPLDNLVPVMVACPPPCPGLDTVIRMIAPGGVLVLMPGTYPIGASLEITKPLTILGPQVGADPRLSVGGDRIAGDTAREAILDGGSTAYNVITILSDDVVISGVELRATVDDVIMAPEMTDGSKWSGIEISYNIIHVGEDMVDIRSADAPHIHHNRMFNAQKVSTSSSNGVVIGTGTDGAIFEYNDVVNVYGTNAGVYFFGATNNTIRGNYLDGVTNDDGIKVGHRSGLDAAQRGGIVENNVIKNTRQDGITIYMSNTTVSGNDVSGSLTSNGAIFVQYALRSVSVTNNLVHDNPGSSSSGSGGIKIGSLVTSTLVGGITVSGNQIWNNGYTGIRHSGGGTLVAENNWFGSASGPYHATMNPTGTGQTQLGTNVDFTPWCTTPTC